MHMGAYKDDRAFQCSFFGLVFQGGGAPQFRNNCFLIQSIYVCNFAIILQTINMRSPFSTDNNNFTTDSNNFTKFVVYMYMGSICISIHTQHI